MASTSGSSIALVVQVCFQFQVEKPSVGVSDWPFRHAAPRSASPAAASASSSTASGRAPITTIGGVADWVGSVGSGGVGLGSLKPLAGPKRSNSGAIVFWGPNTLALRPHGRYQPLVGHRTTI
eukprot:COSAG04_NODE_261_length_18676_cov_8.426603_8_plen_123_part_00